MDAGDNIKVKKSAFSFGGKTPKNFDSGLNLDKKYEIYPKPQQESSILYFFDFINGEIRSSR